MKKTISIIFFINLIFHAGWLHSQCTITAGINNTSTDNIEICDGTMITLMSDGVCNYLMSNNFNNGQIGSGWASNCSPMFNNPCGAGSDGTTYLWIGDASSFPRNLVTAPFDVLAGGCQICFDLRFAIQGQNTPCEGPDEIDEGVELQYSTDNGATWVSIIYFRPDGQFFTNNQWIGQGSSVGSGNTPFTAWHNYCYSVPPQGQTNHTMFRWHQEQVTDNDYDHWGLDNVNIYCPSNQLITWTANPPQSGFPHSGANTSPFTPPVGTNTYTATIVDSLNPGNTANDVVTVIVHPNPTSTFDATPVICSDQNATITYTGTASPSATYTWDFGGGIVISGSGQGPYEINWPNGGTYNISLTVTENSCVSGTTNVAVLVHQKPTSDFTLTSPVCNDTYSIITYRGNAGSGAEYHWDFSGGRILSGSNAGPYNINWRNFGTYTVSLYVVENGCYSDTTSGTVTVYAPDAIATADPMVTSMDSIIQFTGSNSVQANTYWWYFGDEHSSNTPNPQHAYDYPGFYDVTLVVISNHGCKDTAHILISVTEKEIIIPNVITPNGDGINENFEIKFIEQYQSSTLVIFNRWGKKIFEASPYKNDWDAKGFADGTYYFVLTYKGVLKDNEIKGSLTVIRGK